MQPITPLPNMRAPFVKVTDSNGKELGKGYLLDPWNGFLQQLVQVAPTPVTITGTSPVQYIANTKGSFLVIGGTVSNISLTRGSDTFNLTGEKIIPISIGDIITVYFSVLPAMNFLGV